MIWLVIILSEVWCLRHMYFCLGNYCKAMTRTWKWQRKATRQNFLQAERGMTHGYRDFGIRPSKKNLWSPCFIIDLCFLAQHCTVRSTIAVLRHNLHPPASELRNGEEAEQTQNWTGVCSLSWSPPRAWYCQMWRQWPGVMERVSGLMQTRDIHFLILTPSQYWESTQ